MTHNYIVFWQESVQTHRHCNTTGKPVTSQYMITRECLQAFGHSHMEQTNAPPLPTSVRPKHCPPHQHLHPHSRCPSQADCREFPSLNAPDPVCVLSCCHSPQPRACGRYGCCRGADARSGPKNVTWRGVGVRCGQWVWWWHEE